MNEPLASASGEAICVPRGKDGNGKAFAAGRRGGCIHLDKPGIRNVYTAPARMAKAHCGRPRPCYGRGGTGRQSPGRLLRLRNSPSPGDFNAF